MNIGIDSRAATEVAAGRGRYVRELLKSMNDLADDDLRFTLYCRRPDYRLRLDHRFHWKKIAVPDPAWHLIAARHASKHCDVFLSTNSYLTAWFTRIPCVLVIHDMIPFVAPEFAQPRAARIERLTIRLALRRAAHIICNSTATRKDLTGLFPSAGKKTSTIFLASHRPALRKENSAALQEKFDLKRPFALAVGTIEPRKNLLSLLQAWERLPNEVKEANELLLVGPQGWQNESINAAISASDARLLGYVSEDELAMLYKLCEAFCYPSLYEGFGLPILEAMQCDAAVITSNISSLPEVAATAAHYVNPHDVESIRDGILEVLTNAQYRSQLITAGQQRARHFSWELTAKKTLRTLRDCASSAGN